MVMLRVYRYVFYKLYCFESMMFDMAPAFTALGLMVVTQILNLGFLLFLAEWLVGRRILPHLPSWQGLAILPLLGVPQYFHLLHRGRFRHTLKEFRHETSRQSVIGGIMVAAYILFSFILLIWSATLPRTP